MATTFLPNKHIGQPANGDLGWDSPLNTNFAIIDACLGSTQNLTLSPAHSDVTLNPTVPPYNTSDPTLASYLCMRLVIYGAPSRASIVRTPAGVAGMWVVINATTDGQNIYFGTAAGGTPATVLLGVNAEVLCFSDGVNTFTVGGATNVGQLAAPGDLKANAGPGLQQGWIYCDGRAVSRTTYSALFAAIGGYYGVGDGSTTFNIPDLRGRVLAGSDDGVGRLNGFSLAVSSGSQICQLTDPGQMPYHNHGGGDHAHGVYQDAHQHNMGGVVINNSTSSFAVAYGNGWPQGGSVTDWQQPAVHIGNSGAIIGGAGSSNPVANIQPTTAVHWFIYAGI
jgi:microcystin-dependent protein